MNDMKKYLSKEKRFSSCPVCDADFENGEVWAKEEYFNAIECQSCGFVGIDPSISPEGLSIYYSNNIERRLNNDDLTKKRKLQYVQDRVFIEQYISEGKILDVGCSGGFFLSTFGDSFEKHGLETDKEAVAHAKVNLPSVKITNALLGDDDYPENSFDLIIFRGVIEHIYDPKGAICRASELLKTGGFLYFCATPNIDCFCADMYREKWNQWHPIQHINIFNAKTLHKMCGLDRYNLVAHDYPYLGTPYENQEDDYRKLTKDILLKREQKWDKVDVSPPFWGNMMSVVLKKIS